ncbi:MAG: twin-arginine translocation signal domain-containing protein, partial [Anaerolineae bacterium]|nr:twin-arginine translocation signal domain-containing protein [Anaerolineae bacterium]
MKKTISRREFLQGSALVVTAAVATACTCETPEPEVVKEEIEVTRVVEKEGEKVVEQVIVTTTPVPVVK